MDQKKAGRGPRPSVGPSTRSRSVTGTGGQARTSPSGRRSPSCAPPPRTPGERVVAGRAAGLPRATALRMIQTLEQEGFLLRNAGDDRVLLGPELLRLARNTDEQLLLREVARPIIGELVAAVRETVTLSVVAPDGGLDLVHQVDAPHQLRPQSWVGQRFPLHASASGKVLLATYDEERLERFLLEPLARFTPSTITTAGELRTELGASASSGTRSSSTRRRKGFPVSRPDPRTDGRTHRRAHRERPHAAAGRAQGATRGRPPATRGRPHRIGASARARVGIGPRGDLLRQEADARRQTLVTSRIPFDCEGTHEPDQVPHGAHLVIRAGRPRPAEGCCPTTAPVGLSLT